MTDVAVKPDSQPLVGVIMGSSSDWDVMQNATSILKQFGVPFEAQVISAHRMPDEMFAYANPPVSAACAPSLPARAAPPTCQAWWRP